MKTDKSSVYGTKRYNRCDSAHKRHRSQQPRQRAHGIVARVKLPAHNEIRSVLLRRALQVHNFAWQNEVSSEVTSVQFGVLRALQEYPGIGQRELGRLTQVDKSTLADLIARLRRNGYVTSARDTTDRRRNVVTLTEAGQDLLDELGPKSMRVNDMLFGGLSAADARELDRLLRLLLTTELARSAAVQ